MHLARHSITSTTPIQINDARFDADARIFTASTPSGFAVYRSWPLKLLRKREFTGGTLAAVLPLHTSSLLFLLGGGRSPLYPPNKVVLWDDALGREVAELEFREKVRGIACRRGWLAVALRRRVVVFQVGEQVTRFQEWDTGDNEKGLVAIATSTFSTLLVISGRQMGHVQLIQLPPCPPPAPKSPPSPTLPRSPPPKPAKHPVSIIAAHTTALAALAVVPSGKLLATASNRGTLVRVWDSHSGELLREFRRGTDKAEIYGVAFRPDEREICVWSDKGTVHVFSLTVDGRASNRHSALSPLTPFLSLPKYFDSEWSFAQYRIPSQTSHISLSSASKLSEIAEGERCNVAWIEVPKDVAASSGRDSNMEYQLIALTYSGGWYRLSIPGAAPSARNSSSTSPPTPSANRLPTRTPLPRPRSSSSSSSAGRGDKGKEKERDSKEGRDCILKEFRRYGRWDGWG